MRKKFLVKPALQMRHLVWTLVAVVVCFSSCYILFENLVTLTVGQGAMDPEQWMVLRSTTRVGFGVALVILLGAIGLENYLFFHSIAGPIYALEKGLRRLAQGDFKSQIKIRDTDQLRDLIELFEDMKTTLANKIESHESLARSLASEIDNALKDASEKNISALAEKLKSIQKKADHLPS